MLASAVAAQVAPPQATPEEPAVRAEPAEPADDTQSTAQGHLAGRAVRVGGSPEHPLESRQARLDDGSTGTMYLAGPMRIVSPLPEGYPPPTPAGAIEVKHYPSVRRAELTVQASPRLGMNMAFFPLFRHIKKRDIAMTAPVEAEVPALAGTHGQIEQADGPTGAPTQPRPDRVTVSFLYRTADMGQPGQAEEGVVVVDTPPVTVLALGVRGAMDNAPHRTHGPPA
ncbi:MAG: hypothetical protein KatS3mg103_0795 [Phycisphaerales bacterium]|nr:MAG: hypothetical protein KatS3mg103_0795 [Phycisphaerales bacterium]